MNIAQFLAQRFPTPKTRSENGAPIQPIPMAAIAPWRGEARWGRFFLGGEATAWLKGRCGALDVGRPRATLEPRQGNYGVTPTFWI